MEKSVTLEMIRDAREALKGVAEVTPVVTSKRLGTNLFIKSENLQKTGSFKIRGAYNKIRHLTPEEASRGVSHRLQRRQPRPGRRPVCHPPGDQVRHLHAGGRTHPEGGSDTGLRCRGGAGTGNL